MISQRMRERRRQMQQTSQGSEVEDLSTSSQAPMITQSNEQLVEDNDEDMLEALQSRRTQRLAELETDDDMFGNADGITSLKPPPSPSPRRELSVDDTTGNASPTRSQSAASSTLNMSIRERLRNRVKSTTATTMDANQSRKLRGLRDRALPNRFDDNRTGFDEDPYVAESLAKTTEWKQTKLKKDEKETGFVTNEDAFQFFVDAVDGMEEGKEVEETMKEASPTHTALLLDLHDSFLINYAKPKRVTQREQRFIEQQIRYVPSTLPDHLYDAPRKNVLSKEVKLKAHVHFLPGLPLQRLSPGVQLVLFNSNFVKVQGGKNGLLRTSMSKFRKVPESMKVGEGAIPRNLEDEGFFIGNAPPVSRATLSKMENRILNSDKDSGWFNEDGNLKRLPNPLKEHPVRQVLHDDLDVDPMLQLDWGKAQQSSLDTRYIDEHGNTHYQIDIDLSAIRFTHQPMFSKEHVLESRLVQLYEHYLLRQKSGLLEHIENKLEALRTSLKQLHSETESIESKQSKLLSREHHKRIHGILLEIREQYLTKENEETRERQLLMNLLHTWQKIKKLRDYQDYINTSTCLKVRKELTNKADDEMKYEREITERLEAERAFFKESNIPLEVEYQKKLNQWKRYRKNLKRRRQKKDDGKENLPPLEEVEKPEPLPAFNEQEYSSNLRQELFKLRRRPGEANLIPELQQGAVITPTEKCPRLEQVRRSSMKGCKYFLKVLFNEIEVSRTPPKKKELHKTLTSKIRILTNDFTIQFGEILNIKILQWPDSIKLQIYDGSSMTMIAQLFAPIPEISIFANNQQTTLEGLEFSSDQIIQYKHEGVGSGVSVDLSLPNQQEPPLIPLTSGILYISTIWGVDTTGQLMAPPIDANISESAVSNARHYDALAALGAAGMVDLQKLLSWISSAKLDPNDPNNADIINLAKMAHMSHLDDITGPKYFRLNQLEGETEFATGEELDENKRFRLIKLRDQGVPELKNYQMIPPDEAFISDDVFEEYEKRINFDDLNDDEEYSQRKAVTRFLAKVREQVHTRSQLARRQLDIEDMIMEEAIPDIGTLGKRISQMLEPRRPLRPMRKERKKIGGQNLAALKDVNILINIVRAFNIPIRIDGPNDSSGPSQSDQSGYNAVTANIKPMVKPFVEVMFQGHFLRTTIAEGAFPNWNEDLILPFKPPNNDYTTDSLQLVKDKIYINLFDEVVVDLLMDERLRPTNVHQRTEKRWLGSIEIPFSTVYFNSKVDGFLQVNSPSVLLGYKKDTTSNKTQRSLDLLQDRTLIQMFITIEPQLQPAPPMPEKFETNENDVLIHNSQLWLSTLRNKFTNREYKTMVSDINGKKVFLTRYMYKQKPPEELLLDDNIPEKQKLNLLARFVSLIPYIADSVQFPDLCDIWATTDQFLQMLAGDEEEHAVLLCNYFLYVGKKAYLVLGHGIPEGSTAYVLSDEGTSYRLWNASTGISFEIQDVHCPLQSIGCLIDASNIYGNIQRDDHPSKLSYDVSNPKCWKPFFAKSNLNPGLASIQVEAPIYVPTDAEFAYNLQEKLERLLRDKLMEWRPRHITKFNRYCTQAFKSLLQNIESKTILTGMSIDEHRGELQQVLASHQLNGFPLHMPYTSNEDVIERVYSTGIHNCEDTDVEFALAVHVHPYPNNVLAVWVYIGCLIRKVA